MKKVGSILAGVLLCFTFIWVLASCSGSKVSQAYADQINNGVTNKTYVTYDTAKKELGKECNDFTLGGDGYMFAIKGYESLDSEGSFMKLLSGDENKKYQLILILCADNNCVNAQYFEGSGAEVSAKLDKVISL